jgi:acyl-CoA reductase-like NAD-dependent aldehyde dehydrogenase
MLPSRRRFLAILILLLAGSSIAPSPPAATEVPAKPTPLAEARYQAALAQYELIWSYFQQNRTDAFQVYYWSRLVLDARREMGETPADRIEALKGHLARMEKMESLIKRIRRLGFGFSADVGATRYYRLEAEHWLARAGEKPK